MDLPVVKRRRDGEEKLEIVLFENFTKQGKHMHEITEMQIEAINM